MATKKESASINIAPMKEIEVEFEIVGRTPLLVHAWSEKARRIMIEKQTKANGGKAKHEPKVPVNDFINSLYWLTEQPADGTNDDEAWANYEAAINNGAMFGFPATGIKDSIIMGAYRAGLDIKTTELRGCISFINGAAEGSTESLARIIAEPPVMREDMVRLGGINNPADVRFRGEFAEWRIPLKMTYIANSKYSLEQILNCVNYGGVYCGIGEWRPEKNGQLGMYRLSI